MNQDAMENDLPAAEFQKLQQELGALAQIRERSDFACECSWTRIRTCLLAEDRSKDLHLWRWAAIGSSLALLALLLLTQAGTSDAPFAESRNPQIWVSGFHSSRAQADVVWATGYDYIPASYPVK